MKEVAEKTAESTIDLREIDEEEENDGEEENKPPRELLSGFKKTNLKIHLLANTDFADLANKKKYQRLFDVGVLSLTASGKIDEKMTKIFKDRASVHTECGDFLVSLKKEQKTALKDKVAEMAAKVGWK